MYSISILIHYAGQFLEFNQVKKSEYRKKLNSTKRVFYIEDEKAVVDSEAINYTFNCFDIMDIKGSEDYIKFISNVDSCEAKLENDITKLYFIRKGNPLIYSDNPESIEETDSRYFNKLITLQSFSKEAPDFSHGDELPFFSLLLKYLFFSYIIILGVE